MLQITETLAIYSQQKLGKSKKILLCTKAGDLEIQNLQL